MHTRSLPSARSRQILAAVVAFALVSVFVIRTSDAAFTVTTDNDDNLFATGQLELRNELTRPLFGEEGVAENPAVDLAQGDVVDGCIDIIYEGTFESGQLTEVSLQVDINGQDDLAGFLDVVVELVDDCDDRDNASTVATGTLAALDGDLVDTGWTPSPQVDSRGYLFTVGVGGEGNDALNLTASGVDLIWSVSTVANN